MSSHVITKKVRAAIDKAYSPVKGATDEQVTAMNKCRERAVKCLENGGVIYLASKKVKGVKIESKTKDVAPAGGASSPQSGGASKPPGGRGDKSEKDNK